MSRPLDWTPLVESGQDPVPGRPASIEQLGRHYLGRVVEPVASDFGLYGEVKRDFTRCPTTGG